MKARPEAMKMQVRKIHASAHWNACPGTSALGGIGQHQDEGTVLIPSLLFNFNL